jgi:hypothetical protein
VNQSIKSLSKQFARIDIKCTLTAIIATRESITQVLSSGSTISNPGTLEVILLSRDKKKAASKNSFNSISWRFVIPSALTAPAGGAGPFGNVPRPSSWSAGILLLSVRAGKDPGEPSTLGTPDCAGAWGAGAEKTVVMSVKWNKMEAMEEYIARIMLQIEE